MVETEEVVCKEGGGSGEETQGDGVVLAGGVVDRLAEDELTDGGGGRPGLALIGGGRRGRSFILAGLEWKKKKLDLHQRARKGKTADLISNLEGRGGSEGLETLVGSGVVWLSEAFLRAGDGGF